MRAERVHRASQLGASSRVRSAPRNGGAPRVVATRYTSWCRPVQGPSAPLGSSPPALAVLAQQLQQPVGLRVRMPEVLAEPLGVGDADLANRGGATSDRGFRGTRPCRADASASSSGWRGRRASPAWSHTSRSRRRGSRGRRACRRDCRRRSRRRSRSAGSSPAAGRAPIASSRSSAPRRRTGRRGRGGWCSRGRPW